MFGELCEQLAAYLQKMDCVYLINGDAWLQRIRDCCPVAVQKREDEEEEGEEDLNPKESEEEVKMVVGDERPHP